MEVARLDNKEMITLLLDNAADPNAINSVSFCNMLKRVWVFGILRTDDSRVIHNIESGFAMCI